MMFVRSVPGVRAFCVLAIPLALGLSSPAAGQDDSMPTMTVVGEGIAAGHPDMALVSVGVVTHATRADRAMAENSKAMNEVIAAVKEDGIESKDLQTSQLSLRPQYSQPTRGSGEARKLVGYEAGNTLAIRVRDLDQLGALLDRLVTVGANQIRGIEFTMAEPDPLRDAARTAAMKDALRRAEILAEAAGVRIVRLFSVTENMQEPPRPMVMRMTAEAAARPDVPIEAGEQEFRGRVTAVFEIAPK